jgi:UDP-N-acetylmuramate dehydrogenase
VKIVTQEQLGPLSTLGVGGNADYYAEASSEEDVRAAVGYADARGLDLWVLGGGSNLVIADDGLRALVLKVALKGVSHHEKAAQIELTVRAGELWDDVVAYSVERRWAGLECLSGIPGLVGATPIQNVGAYGQEVSDTIRSVHAFDRKTKALVELGASECHFEYRSSVFKKAEPDRYIVLGVTYELRVDGAPTIEYAELSGALAGSSSPSLAQVRDTVIALRTRKSMVLSTSDPNGRSCGSFFVNPVIDAAKVEEIARLTHPLKPPAFAQGMDRYKVAAAWLIERAGFEKGTRRGTVGLSNRHSLAIVCHEGAKARDVVRLAREIQNRVFERFGVLLSPEPSFAGFNRFEQGLPLLDD